MRHKHRVLVEVIFDKRVTSKFASKTISDALKSVEFETYDLGPGEPRILNYKAKEAERVIQSEINWKNRRLPSDGEPGEP